MPQADSQHPDIFISYRRDDSAGYARALYEHLSARLGGEQVFMDVDKIEPGVDFVRVIEGAVGSCKVLLALIGRDWLKGDDGAGQAVGPSAFVRLEIAAAFARNIPVVPVLIGGARMPQDLPDDLTPLARLNAFELSGPNWNRDVVRLVALLEKVMSRSGAASQGGRRAWWGRFAGTFDSARPGFLLLTGFTVLAAIIAAIIAAWVGRDTPNVNLPPNLNVPQPTRQPPPQLTPVPTPRISLPATDPPIVNAVGMEFVWVPPGEFMMGSENGEADERPVHRVVFGRGFYVGKYEVTQAQWRAVMGNNPSHFRGESLPVETVWWHDAQKFIEELNRLNDGYSYSLPTEAQWEYACRAGTTGDFAGDLDAMAWYYPNSGDTRLVGVYVYERGQENNNRPHPVGLKEPNAFGLFDMHGNVAEWVGDIYHDSYKGAPANGNAWLTKGGGPPTDRHIVRGGSWKYTADALRSADRDLDLRDFTTGFRVVAVVRR